MKHIEKNGGGQTNNNSNISLMAVDILCESKSAKTFRKLGKHRNTNSEQLGPKYENTNRKTNREKTGTYMKHIN